MPLQPNSLPRLDQAPYDNPENFIATWDTTMDAIESGAGSGSSGEAFASFVGNGRIISAAVPVDAGDDFLPDTPSLAIKLPDGMQWIQDGLFITIDGDIVISGISPNFTGWVQPVYDTDTDTWSKIEHATRPAKGAGVFKIVSDVDSVNSVDVSAVNSDTIPTLPYLLTLIGGGSGYDDSAVVGRIETLETTSEDHEERISNLEELSGANGGESLADTGPDRDLNRITARLETRMARLAPIYQNETDSSLFIGGIAGDGYELENGVTGRDIHSGNTTVDLLTGEES